MLWSRQFARPEPAAVLRPVTDATAALTRVDERIARSTAGAGVLKRTHFTDACALLWIDGHLEDLVLHDARLDAQAPTHASAIARDVLTTRRRIASQRAGWALRDEGLRTLRGAGAESTSAGDTVRGNAHRAPPPATTFAEAVGGGEGAELEASDPLAAELAAIDAVLARSDAAIAEAKVSGRGAGREKDQLD